MTQELKNQIIDYFENQKIISDYLFIEEPIQIDRNDNLTNELVEDLTFNTELKNEKPAEIPSQSSDMTETNNDFSVNPGWRESTSLETLYNDIHTCLRCSLGSTRKNFVFGSGNPKAEIMIIGEAPGAEEDEQGLPFVGKAGQLLTKIIESIELKRDDVYICNICKCRPPNNRAPFASEVESCLPYLLRQIEIIKPKFILALGATAVGSLTGKKPVMGEVRGKLTDFHGTKMLITYHPAALLYNPNLKRDVWEDMKLLKRLIQESKN